MLAPHFRHPVRGDVPERRQQLPRAIRGRHRARHPHREDAGTERPEVPRARLLHVGQRLHVGLEAVELGGALALDQVEGLVGVEGLGEDLPVAAEHGAERPVDIAEDVEQRQVVDDAVALGGAEPPDAVDGAADQRVVAHHALGEPGGARRVHDEDGVGGAHRRGTSPHQRAIPPLCRRDRVGEADGPGVARIALHDEPGRSRLARHREVVDGAGHVVGDQGGGVGLAQHVLEVGGAEARVDRHVDGADAGQREHQEDPLRAVGEPDANLLARLDAEAEQAGGVALHLALDVAERVAPLLEDQGLAVAEAPRRLRGQRGVGRGGAPVGVRGIGLRHALSPRCGRDTRARARRAAASRTAW
jgi:hypothetical protein